MGYTLSVLFHLLFLFTPAKKEIPASIYDFKVAGLSGHEIDLSAYKGKKILIVNTPWIASDDPQYAELNDLYKKYQDKLVVIGVLTEDFGIAPGSKRQAYTKKEYPVSFPMTEHVDVRGPNMTPVFTWLTNKEYNGLSNTEVKWDFQKYLIDENGKLIAVFDPKVRAADPRIISAIMQ